MTQIAILLAVTTVLIGLWSLISTFYCQGGGGLIRKTKLPMQKLELKEGENFHRSAGSKPFMEKMFMEC